MLLNVQVYRTVRDRRGTDDGGKGRVQAPLAAPLAAPRRRTRSTTDRESRLVSCHHYCQCLPTSDDRYSYSFNKSWIQLQYKCLTIVSILDPCAALHETLLSLQRSIPVEERLDLRRTHARKQTSKARSKPSTVRIDFAARPNNTGRLLSGRCGGPPALHIKIRPF